MLGPTFVPSFATTEFGEQKWEWKCFSKKTTSSSLSAGTLNAWSVHGRDFSTLSSRSANNPPQPFGPIGSIRLTYFFGDPAIKHVGSIRSVGGPWIPINLYGFLWILWFPKGISVTKRKNHLEKFRCLGVPTNDDPIVGPQAGLPQLSGGRPWTLIPPKANHHTTTVFGM